MDDPIHNLTLRRMVVSLALKTRQRSLQSVDFVVGGRFVFVKLNDACTPSISACTFLKNEQPVKKIISFIHARYTNIDFQ